MYTVLYKGHIKVRSTNCARSVIDPNGVTAED